MPKQTEDTTDNDGSVPLSRRDALIAAFGGTLAKAGHDEVSETKTFKAEEQGEIEITISADEQDIFYDENGSGPTDLFAMRTNGDMSSLEMALNNIEVSWNLTNPDAVEALQATIKFKSDRDNGDDPVTIAQAERTDLNNATVDGEEYTIAFRSIDYSPNSPVSVIEQYNNNNGNGTDLETLLTNQNEFWDDFDMANLGDISDNPESIGVLERTETELVVEVQSTGEDSEGNKYVDVRGEEAIDINVIPELGFGAAFGVGFGKASVSDDWPARFTEDGYSM